MRAHRLAEQAPTSGLCRFKKALETRHCELRVGMAQGDLNNPSVQHDYGKDEGVLRVRKGE